MKHFNIVVRLFVVFLLFSCHLKGQQLEGKFYGDSFEAKMVATKSDKLQVLTKKDSISLQLEGKIVEVCQAKGCWMKVDLTDGEQVFVRFKDYGFFVPTDSAEKSTVLNGIAFIEEMSVEDQKHYAADKGATEEELARITEPKKTFRFEADGVLIKSK
ncbi:DUF4920 domain-containing protein [Croceivirga thetidis]|uniref:DUF4920 domain-containing protein n=1 Tax=Croceivirga thetidis TaxID=2721623 RepID=A0ABX1GSQ9_9FLAO|nr:DUF4920 domain-containing protein [Croceivirga thetidis]NKI32992.1 DUF4920 domain-containing protein [Croceivirga thetidis]